MKCLIHVYLKSIGSDKFSDIWLDMESILENKYRWRQVLWADALIQMPRKTGERKLDRVFPECAINIYM